MTAECKVTGCALFKICLGKQQLATDRETLSKHDSIGVRRDSASQTAQAYKDGGCIEPEGLDAEVEQFPV